MASTRQRPDFDGASVPQSCSLNKDAQPGNGFCIDVHPSHSLGELGYVKYNNRPSVIYFHGSLSTKASPTENIVTSPKLLLKANYSTDPSKITTMSDNLEVYTEEEKQQFISQGLSESQEEDEQCRCKKRHRTSYSSMQLKRLEEEFDGDNYIIGMKRWRLSEELEIPEKQIKIWFQNRRTKSKKHCSKDFYKPDRYQASENC